MTIGMSTAELIYFSLPMIAEPFENSRDIFSIKFKLINYEEIIG